jgi:hypothetical protein
MSDNYQAGEPGWIYPDLGEPVPERSDAKVHLLAISGICIPGHWTGDPFYIAWSPLPKRDREKEARVAEARSRSSQTVRSNATRRTDHSEPNASSHHPASGAS